MPVCRFCLKPLPAEGKIQRTAACSNCGRDLHCCRNCRFHDRAAHNECLEPQAEWVADRDKANFCDYFEIADIIITGPLSRAQDQTLRRGGASPMSAAAGKGDPVPEAKKRLEELFKKE